MKGFKKDGKFRPTGNRNKSSLKKSDIKPDPENDQNIVIGKNEHLKNYYGKTNKKTLEPKMDPRVEEQFSSGNPEEMIWWKVNDVSATPVFDDLKGKDKVIPLDFYIFTVIDQQNHEEEDTYIANLVAVPRKFGKEKWQNITDEIGQSPEENADMVNVNDALLMGEHIPIRDVKDAKSSAEAINKVLENISADAGAIGFTLDRRLNVFGETGWDKLRELALDEKMSTDELIDRQREIDSR